MSRAGRFRRRPLPPCFQRQRFRRFLQYYDFQDAISYFAHGQMGRQRRFLARF